jgi:hypothetical protein
MTMRIAAALAGLAVAGGAWADAIWYSRTENDVAFATDRWFSSGFLLARVKDDVEYGFVQQVYTPEAKVYVPGHADRSPVGRLFFYGAWQDRADERHRTVEFFAGVRGPAALGRQITEQVHEIIAAPRVDWERQLDNRFDGGLVYAHSRHFGPFTGHVGAVLGSQITFAHAGIEIRAGTLPPIAAEALRFAATPLIAREHGWSAFAGASVRGVARNDLLERNYDPGGPPLEREHGVVRAAIGATLAGRWGTVELQLVRETREFTAQRAPSSWGSLALLLRF